MNKKNILAAIILAALVLVGYMVFNKPDDRNFGEKLGDAASKLDNGVDNAVRELEDRTPAERIKDDIKDATDGSPE